MAAEMTKRVTFTLSEDMETAMREAAWQSRMTVSEWLREAIKKKLVGV